MTIAILGTGPVGRTLAEKLVSLGHEVVLGTRDPAVTADRTEPGAWGTPSFSAWRAVNPGVRLATFADATGEAEWAINAASGDASLAVVTAASAGLDGKVLLDLGNPLNFSKGLPPTLSVCNDDSLAERLQRAAPRARVVKALNTVTAALMVAPGLLAGGDHTSFVCGDDPAARGQVVSFLREQFGWTDVIDLGDLSQARGVEMYLPLWLRLFSALKTPMFSIKVVR